MRTSAASARASPHDAVARSTPSTATTDERLAAVSMPACDGAEPLEAVGRVQPCPVRACSGSGANVPAALQPRPRPTPPTIDASAIGPTISASSCRAARATSAGQLAGRDRRGAARSPMRVRCRRPRDRARPRDHRAAEPAERDRRGRRAAARHGRSLLRAICPCSRASCSRLPVGCSVRSSDTSPCASPERRARRRRGQLAARDRQRRATTSGTTASVAPSDEQADDQPHRRADRPSG